MKNRLENLKKALAMNWGELADYIGISRSMLDFLRNGVREPGKSTLRKIEAAECSIVGNSGAKIPTENGPDVGKSVGRQIPIVSLSAAEMYDPSLSNLCDLWDGTDERATYIGPTADAVFAVRIQGDSMLPVLCDGDVIAVTEILPATGDLCLVRHKSDGILCKKWYWRNDVIRLDSINPAGKNYRWTKAEFTGERPLVWRFKVEALIYRKLSTKTP